MLEERRPSHCRTVACAVAWFGCCMPMTCLVEVWTPVFPLVVEASVPVGTTFPLGVALGLSRTCLAERRNALAVVCCATQEGRVQVAARTVCVPALGYVNGDGVSCWSVVPLIDCATGTFARSGCVRGNVYCCVNAVAPLSALLWRLARLQLLTEWWGCGWPARGSPGVGDPHLPR